MLNLKFKKKILGYGDNRIKKVTFLYKLNRLYRDF